MCVDACTIHLTQGVPIMLLLARPTWHAWKVTACFERGAGRMQACCCMHPSRCARCEVYMTLTLGRSVPHSSACLEQRMCAAVRSIHMVQGYTTLLLPWPVYGNSPHALSGVQWLSSAPSVRRKVSTALPSSRNYPGVKRLIPIQKVTRQASAQCWNPGPSAALAYLLCDFTNNFYARPSLLI